jgi:hypothetical protein
MPTHTPSPTARNLPVRVWLLAVAVALVCVIVWRRPVFAHPMSFGSVRLERVEQRLDGDLVLDVPETVQEQPDNVRRTELADQVRSGFALETELGRLAPSVDVRELGHGSSAVDVAAVTYVLPKGAQRLRVVTTDAIGDVAVELVDVALQLRERTVVAGGSTSRWIELVPSNGPPSMNASGPEAPPTPGLPAVPRGLDAQGVPREARSVLDYASLGFRHIVPEGLDHLLFVSSLVLLVEGWAALVVLLSVFTLGHTLSVAWTLFGGPPLASSWVEPLIALSLAYAALEDVRAGWTKFRPLVALGFGLVHGLGFAGALGQVHVPQDERVLALLGFNLGVEAGQLLFAGFALGGVVLLRRRLDPTKVRRVSVRTIAGIGLFWAAMRVLGALGV